MPLLVFAALYLVPLAFSPSWRWFASSISLAAVIATGSWLIARFASRTARRPRSSEQCAVAMTSAAEGIVLAAAIGIGILSGAWWLTLPLLFTAVTMHILSLGIAYRRAFDAWSLSWIAAATVLSWSFGAVPEGWTWPFCGAVAAGVCIGYVFALLTDRRRGALRSDAPLEVPVQKSASPAT